MNMSAQGFDPTAYETGEYGDILRMIRAGASDEEILQAHPKWPVDVLGVCRKIVNGTLCQLDPEEYGTRRIYTRVRATMPPKTDAARYAQKLRSMGFTLQQIADRMRVSVTSVRNWMGLRDHLK